MRVPPPPHRAESYPWVHGLKCWTREPWFPFFFFSKITNVYIAGRSPSHPFLNFNLWISSCSTCMLRFPCINSCLHWRMNHRWVSDSFWLLYIRLQCVAVKSRQIAFFLTKPVNLKRSIYNQSFMSSLLRLWTQFWQMKFSGLLAYDWTALALQTGNIFAWNQLYQTFAAELSANF